MSEYEQTIIVEDYPASIDASTWDDLYDRSLNDPEAFWMEHGRCLDWRHPYTRARSVSYGPQNVHIRWFEDGLLNASYNCIDRHLELRGDQTALIWEGDEPGIDERLTYYQLHESVCRLANGIKSLGIRKGDFVTIYLPMIPEAAIAMLACARVGAIHSVVFAGFSPDALADRVRDCHSRLIITADEGVRGGKRIPLKRYVEEARKNCPSIESCIVVKRTGDSSNWNAQRDVSYDELVESMDSHCDPEWMKAEDPLFVLYTSGSTGKPKGIVHSTGGYLVACALSHRYVLDCKPDDVYWCTADVGWVTGHSYIVYGPLANGATTLLFEGIPTYPTPSRFWEICDKYGVTIFYTAPTAIRALMREGNAAVERTDRSSLRLLGSVGEPINPEAWRWYYEVVGAKRCPVIDTWWQTETGAIMIAPIPGVTPLKPGSATRPFLGVVPVIVDQDGRKVDGAGDGNLCLSDGGPGMVRTILGDRKRFEETYFARYPGLYFTGDGCRRDKDGYYWITGRVDDVINVSGHRLGTAEIESALVGNPRVAEAAVVGIPDSMKGQGIYAFVTLKLGEQENADIRRELVAAVRKRISPIASPDVIQWAPALPKTRSGKIMRRILRKIAEGRSGDLGDTSTLAEPDVVVSLIQGHKALSQNAGATSEEPAL